MLTYGSGEGLIWDQGTESCVICREISKGRVKTLAVRGAGSFIGEPNDFMRPDGSPLGWQHSVKAKGEIKTMFLSFRKFSELSMKHPEFEADGRAGKAFLHGRQLLQVMRTL